MLRFLVGLIIILHSALTVAQGEFLRKQDKVFSMSEQQWLIREFSENEKNIPNPNSLATIESAKSSAREFLRSSEKLDEKTIQEFEAIYFPNQSNDRFLKLVSICHLYFPLIEKKLSNNNLSRSWKYLPLLLSGYNQHYTNDLDRSGLFAFDFIIAKKYGLRIDTLVDERKGGDITVDAAVKHIKWLNQLFQNDERLMLKAWYVSIPFAKSQIVSTGNTQPEIEAEQFTAFFRYTTYLFDQCVYQLPNKLTNYFDILGFYEPIPIKDTIHIEALVNVLGASLQQLRDANPVFVGDYLDPDYKRTTYLINKNQSGKLSISEAMLYVYKPAPKPSITPPSNETYETEQKIYHIVKKGESLGLIAKKNKVSISEIKKWNKLKSDKIRYGQKLIIYKKVRRPKPKPDPEVENPNIDPTAVPEAADATIVIDSIRPDSIKKPSLDPPNIKPEIKNPGEKTIYYKVKSGDSLWHIAKKYDVTPEQIMKWNKIGEKIRPGQRLKIITKN